MYALYVLEDLGDVDIALGPHLDLLVLQGTTKSTRKKSQELCMYALYVCSESLDITYILYEKSILGECNTGPVGGIGTDIPRYNIMFYEISDRVST